MSSYLSFPHLNLRHSDGNWDDSMCSQSDSIWSMLLSLSMNQAICNQTGLTYESYMFSAIQSLNQDICQRTRQPLGNFVPDRELQQQIATLERKHRIASRRLRRKVMRQLTLGQGDVDSNPLNSLHSTKQRGGEVIQPQLYEEVSEIVQDLNNRETELQISRFNADQKCSSRRFQSIFQRGAKLPMPTCVTSVNRENEKTVLPHTSFNSHLVLPS